MSNYFNLLPNELLYNIIYYIKDKYLLNKLILSDNQLNHHFSNDNNWKEMLYSIKRTLVINMDHTWRDNYLDNMNIKDKYNLEIIDTRPNSYKYAVFFINITGDETQMKNSIDNITQGYSDYINLSNDYIPIITNGLKFVIIDLKENALIYAKIIDFIDNKIKIKSPYIVFHVDLMDIYLLRDLIDNYGLYRPFVDSTNIIKTKIDDIDIILVDAPELI